MPKTNNSTEGVEYDLAFIRNNPIQSVCIKCKKLEPINAPSLENVNCFWCWGKLMPVDLKAYRLRVADLWRHTVDHQLSLPLVTDFAVTEVK